jgi:sugar lactone lactonase YvrE
MVFPNGLAFSPDERVPYIDDFRRGHIRAFDLAPSGILAKQTDRVFVDINGPEPSGPDGMKVDIAGNVYCGGSGGIYIMGPGVKNSAASFMGATRRLISPSVAMIGERSTSPTGYLGAVK